MHCHTSFSDAKKTPEEVKEIYKNMGYSVLAITDHEIFVPHDYLNDEDFLCLHGFEMDVGEDGPKPFKLKMSCHIGCIALSPDNLIQPCYNREKYVYGDAIQHRHLIKYDDTLPDYIRELSPAGISDIMTKTAESGFFVTYNHPTWCMQSYNEYINYYGMHATEIFNGGCLLMGYEDSDAKIYDDFLRTGRHLYCIGADDNHNYYEMGDVLCDSGRAFRLFYRRFILTVMI